MALVHITEHVPSADTLRSVWIAAERNGRDPVRLLRRVANSVEAAHIELIDRARSEKAKQSRDVTPNEDHAGASQKYSDVLDNFFEIVLDSLDFQNFRPIAIKGAVIRQKQTFKLNFRSAAEWFASQVLSRQLRSQFASQFSNRNATASLVADSFRWIFPRVVVRTDIENCYESIPHSVIEKLMFSDGGVSTSTLRSIRSLLTSYADIVGHDRGIPRGIGLSASIAEYVLSQADKVLRADPHCILYVRYVDDIFASFAGDSSSPDEIRMRFESEFGEHGLKLSPKAGKNIFRAVSAASAPGPIEFLGYRFTFGRSGEHVSLANERKARLRSRIDACFNTYTGSSKSTWETRALLMRLRFLTSNTRLRNNKRNAYVGIRYSQPTLNNMAPLQELTKHLHATAQAQTPGPISKRILKLDFESGFKDSTFISWSDEDLQLITAVWKHLD